VPSTVFTRGRVVLPDRVIDPGYVACDGGTIRAVGEGPGPAADEVIDAANGFLVPGYVDLHVHGGDGADFMDATPEAFATVCRAHARHGTTTLLPTTTVAACDLTLSVLELCRRFRAAPDPRGARVAGAHFYGPYFAPAARGCHPGTGLRPPADDDFAAYLAYADDLRLATVAPELAGAEAFVRACRAAGVRCNAGHSLATFEQVEAAVGWGVRHVDHLYCAMSDKSKLRQTQAYPMRGGLLEATLYFDELTTEVIADGKHLDASLLRLAYKFKGPERLALVTDANRALGMPDGEYIFGPRDGGERFVRRDGVGIMPDGSALASGVMGLDEAVRVMRRATGAPLSEVVRMASLTPARIAGIDAEVGSLEPGKRADVLLLDDDLGVRAVYRDGRRLGERPA
jgi:N-acetylglucosamine-6-phosphate deacetylase